MDIQQTTILILSLIVFAISLFSTAQQFIYLHNESKSITVKTKSQYSENKLDLSFFFMMMSLLIFIFSIKNML